MFHVRSFVCVSSPSFLGLDIFYDEVSYCTPNILCDTKRLLFHFPRPWWPKRISHHPDILWQRENSAISILASSSPSSSLENESKWRTDNLNVTATLSWKHWVAIDLLHCPAQSREHDRSGLLLVHMILSTQAASIAAVVMYLWHLTQICRWHYI